MNFPPLSQTIPSSCLLSPELAWPVLASRLPSSPGVYCFSAGKNNLIYIGKAKNLRHRVSSYRLAANNVGKTKLMLSHAKSLRYATTASELQALLLEANLIKTYLPKYNLRLKDDKSPLYITITKETFPHITVSRRSGDFGPFASSTQVRHILKLARRIFPYCSATTSDQTRGKACFYYHLKLCSGACVGKVTPRTYAHMIRHLKLFLIGDHHHLERHLHTQMTLASKKHDFETAATYRDQLQVLSQLHPLVDTDELERHTRATTGLRQLQTMLKLTRLPARIEGYDIANLQGHQATGSMVVLVHGKPEPNQYRHFKINSVTTTPNDPAMIAQVISRRLRHPEWGRPDLILVDGGKPQINAAAKNTNLPIIGLAKQHETIIFNNQPIQLPKNSLALQLLQTLRDEAHRFSRRLHHHLRDQLLY